MADKIFWMTRKEQLMPPVKCLLISAGLLVLIFADVAHAYLDPGTGSFILQMLLAGLVGGIVAIKIFWRSIKLKLSSLFSKKQKKQDDDK